jgi:hypothetical protein
LLKFPRVVQDPADFGNIALPWEHGEARNQRFPGPRIFFHISPETVAKKKPLGEDLLNLLSSAISSTKIGALCHRNPWNMVGGDWNMAGL